MLDEILAGQAVHGTSEELLGAEWLITEEDPGEKVFRKELGPGETAAIQLLGLEQGAFERRRGRLPIPAAALRTVRTYVLDSYVPLDS